MTSDDEGDHLVENPFGSEVAQPRHDAPATLPRHANNEEYNRRWESSFKLDILGFQGSLQAEEFLYWLGAVEEILDFKDALDNKRVSLVATNFQVRASAWWQQLKFSRARYGKEKKNLLMGKIEETHEAFFSSI